VEEEDVSGRGWEALDGGVEGGEGGEDSRGVKAEVREDGFAIACDFEEGKVRVRKGGFGVDEDT